MTNLMHTNTLNSVRWYLMFVNYGQVQIQGVITCLKSVLPHKHKNSAFYTKSNKPCSWIN